MAPTDIDFAESMPGTWRRAPVAGDLGLGRVAVPAGLGVLRKLIAFGGPGYLVSVGYMDPGNWATDLGGGSAFGYELLSVVLISGLLAMLLQALSLRLGIATGRDLAQACRDAYPRPVAVALWLLAEIGIVACDLAEVLGTAIALQLLFGLPLLPGVLLTALDTLVVLGLQRHGFRALEALVIGLILLIGLAFGYEILAARPDMAAILAACLPAPAIVTRHDELYLAIGILGATVMPHNLYLHSALAQTRGFARNAAGRGEAIRYATIDSTVALALALLINAAILILAAAVFHRSGHTDVAGIEDAHRLLAPLLGAPAAASLFALALLCAGQNATLTGTLAGQIVMEGFVALRLPPWLRRLITRSLAILPAGLVIGLAGEHAAGGLLIASQVVLSLQLPFAIVPLVAFTGDRAKMGRFASPPWLRAAAWAVAAAIIALNLLLLLQIAGLA